jgi:tetratricopeptide (TPR) repeat protein
MSMSSTSTFHSPKLNLALQAARACAMSPQGWFRRSHLLTEIVVAQVHLGDWGHAFREIARHTGSATKGAGDLRAELLAAMAYAQVSRGDLYAALSTIRHATLVGMGYSAFSFFLSLCRIAGAPGKIAGDTTANDALDLAEEIFAKELPHEKTGSSGISWLTYLAEAQTIRGRRDQAALTLRAALDLVASDRYDMLRREEAVNFGYSEIAMVHARIGDIPGALQTLERMSEKGRIEDGLPRMVSALAYYGDLLGAFSLAARIESAEPKIYAVIGIAQVQAQRGDIMGAKKTFARIEPFSRRSYRCGQSIGSYYCALARAEAQQGDRDRTRDVLAEILHIIDNAQLGSWLTTEVYIAVAEAYATVGMAEEARQIFERVFNDADTGHSWTALARAITEAHTVVGQVADSVAWIQTLPAGDMQCSAWLGIVDGLYFLSQNAHCEGPY